jgi:hypothetical protein
VEEQARPKQVVDRLAQLGRTYNVAHRLLPSLEQDEAPSMEIFPEPACLLGIEVWTDVKQGWDAEIRMLREIHLVATSVSR